MPDLLVQDELARGELIEVLPSCRSEPMPINLVYSSGRLIPARVRVTLKALEALRKRPQQGVKVAAAWPPPDQRTLTSGS